MVNIALSLLEVDFLMSEIGFVELEIIVPNFCLDFNINQHQYVPYLECLHSLHNQQRFQKQKGC